MPKNLRKIIIPTVTVATAISLLNYGLAKNRMFEALSAVLILITLYWLWANTRATHEMREEMSRQNHLALRPILNLYLRHDGATAGRFSIRNVGHVPAYNIEVEPIELGGQTYIFHFVGENFILEGGGDEQPLEIFVQTDTRMNSIGSEIFRGHFTPPADNTPDALSANRPIFGVFIIRYSNLFSEKFYSLFKYYSQHPVTHEVMIEFVVNGAGPVSRDQAYAKAGMKAKRRPLFAGSLLSAKKAKPK